MRELDRSKERRQMNRGYLLYYHGDLSHGSEPPFMDTAPLRSWSYTRAEVLEMLSDPKYQANVKPTRQAIDLYTFFDFCISRSEVVSGQEGRRLRQLADDLWTRAAVPVEVGARLLAQVAVSTDEDQ
jgi:hypothetical protein